LSGSYVKWPAMVLGKIVSDYRHTKKEILRAEDNSFIQKIDNRFGDHRRDLDDLLRSNGGSLSKDDIDKIMESYEQPALAADIERYPKAEMHLKRFYRGLQDIETLERFARTDRSTNEIISDLGCDERKEAIKTLYKDNQYNHKSRWVTAYLMLATSACCAIMPYCGNAPKWDSAEIESMVYLSLFGSLIMVLTASMLYGKKTRNGMIHELKMETIRDLKRIDNE